MGGAELEWQVVPGWAQKAEWRPGCRLCSPGSGGLIQSCLTGCWLLPTLYHRHRLPFASRVCPGTCP